MTKYLGFLVFSLMLLCSCGGDDPEDCARDFANNVNGEISDFNEAGMRWANDPSNANCASFKEAAQNYLNAVRNFSGCADLSDAEFDSALTAAEEAFDSIGC